MAPRVLGVPLGAMGSPKVSRPAHLRLSTADHDEEQTPHCVRGGAEQRARSAAAVSRHASS
eukprot:7315351-Prymnesium_polylepis.1